MVCSRQYDLPWWCPTILVLPEMCGWVRNIPCDWETWWSSDSRYQLQTETYSLLDSSCSYLMINERNEDDWAATECFSRLYSIQTVGGNLTSPTALCNCIFKSQITFCLLSRNIRLQCSTSWFGYWQYCYVPCHVNSLTCKVGWYSFSVHFLATVFFKSWAVFYWRLFEIFACEFRKLSARCGIFELFACCHIVMMAVCHVRILSRAFRVGQFILGSCALPPQYN